MALADTKPTVGTVSPPSAPEILVADAPTSKLSTFWRTVKPFGWQGLLLVGVLFALYAPVLRILVGQWYSDADYSHGFLVPSFGLFVSAAARQLRRFRGIRPCGASRCSLGQWDCSFLAGLGCGTAPEPPLFVVVHPLRAGCLLLRRGHAAGHGFSMAFLCLPFHPGCGLRRNRFPLQFVAEFSVWLRGPWRRFNLFSILREGNVL